MICQFFIHTASLILKPRMGFLQQFMTDHHDKERINGAGQQSLLPNSSFFVFLCLGCTSIGSMKGKKNCAGKLSTLQNSSFSVYFMSWQFFYWSNPDIRGHNQRYLKTTHNEFGNLYDQNFFQDGWFGVWYFTNRIFILYSGATWVLIGQFVCLY